MNKVRNNFDYHAEDYKDKNRSQIETSHQIIDEILYKRQDMWEMAEWVKRIPPTVCFSRVIGVGAVEIADILGRMLNYRVIERQLLEHITKETQMKDIDVESFHQRYPKEFNRYLFLLFGKNGFEETEETVLNRHLFTTILSLAGLGPTIFVGWGTHLILPRDKTLAVRLICSDSYRTDRLSKIFNKERGEIESELKKIDQKQKQFFADVFNRQRALTNEFDLIINCDYLPDHSICAETVALVFKKKFGLQ